MHPDTHNPAEENPFRASQAAVQREYLRPKRPWWRLPLASPESEQIRLRNASPSVLMNRRLEMQNYTTSDILTRLVNHSLQRARHWIHGEGVW